MSLQYLGLKEINGPLVFLDHVKGVGYEEMVELRCEDGTSRLGRVVQLEGELAAIQVFEGTNGLSLTNTRTQFKGKPMELSLSKELLGRVFNGSGKPIDGLGEIYAEKSADINGQPLNPVSRVYPRNYINTGISSIDALMTLIRGQKLPIFSGSGMPHNELAVQLVKQAKISDGDGKNFCIVFAAMGVKNDVADYFRRSFEEAGVMEHVVMFVNLSNDPIIERTLTPRCALSAAEYLAFEHDMHVLVILTDITSYCEMCIRDSYYNVSQEVVMESLVPVEGRLRKSTIMEMVNAADDQTFQKLLAQSRYHLRFEEEDNIDIEWYMDNIRYQNARRKLYYSQKAPVVFSAYAVLQKNELTNIIRIIEGVRYQVDSDTIASMLIY